MKKFISLLILTLSTAALSHGHCQIPCGIYGDETRFVTLAEHITTIRKSIAEIEKESAADKPNYNQLVRWVNNKETHADEITEIATQYFLAQRIKPTQEHYEEKLKALHSIIVYSMKCKQKLGTENVDALEKAIAEFKGLYFHHKH